MVESTIFIHITRDKSIDVPSPLAWIFKFPFKLIGLEHPDLRICRFSLATAAHFSSAPETRKSREIYRLSCVFLDESSLFMCS